MSAKNTTVDRVQANICAAFGLSREQLLSRNRGSHVATARMVGIYLTRKFLPALPFSTIAGQFNRKRHSTAIHACAQVSRWMAENPCFRKTVNGIAGQIKKGGHT